MKDKIFTIIGIANIFMSVILLSMFIYRVTEKPLLVSGRVVGTFIDKGGFGIDVLIKNYVDEKKYFMLKPGDFVIIERK